MNILVSTESTDQVDDVTSTTKVTVEEDEVETDIETPFNSPERETNIGPSLSTSITESRKEKKSMYDDSDVEDKVTKALSAVVNVKEKGANEEDEDDYSNWPMSNIKDPHENDVLYGRGGGTNHHPGNKRYRKLVEGRKVDYVNSKRLDKPLVALGIINQWRTQVPPGRFLKMDEDSGMWYDVGDKKAREKTSQALREKAPLLRKQQAEQMMENEPLNEGAKNTRFNVPEKSTSKVDKSLSRVILARDHSLGRDYIAADEPVSVRGFSWNSPILDTQIEGPSQSSSWEDQMDSEKVAYAVRGSGSSRLQPPNHPTSSAYASSQYPATYPHDTVPSVSYNCDWATQAPYPHNACTPSHTNTMNEWKNHHSDDLARKSYFNPESDYYQTRSADDAYRRSKHDYYHTGTTSSHVHSADYERFASYAGPNSSNYMQNWTSMRPNTDCMYDSSSYQSPSRIPSTESYGHGHQSWTSPQPMQPSPQRSMNYYINTAYNSTNDAHNMSGCDQYIVSSNSREDIPRPPVVKRDTSNKLQTVDVEPTKKRMNRQTSMSSVGEVTDVDIRNLNDSLEQSSLTGSGHPLKKPQNLTGSDRLNTIDLFSVDFDELDSSPFDDQTKGGSTASKGNVGLNEVVLKPSLLTDNDRISTIGTIDSEILGGLTNTAPV